MEVLAGMGITQGDLRLLKNLYWQQEAAVLINEELTGWFQIKRGVRQGCVMSPIMYNAYSEYLMREVLNEEDGFKVNGKVISSVRHDDDTALIADSEETLQRIVDRLVEKGESYGLKVNSLKTEVMVISREKVNPRVSIKIGNKELKQVENFVYLGSNISSDGRCATEIKRRIGQAKSAFNNMKELLKGDISLRLRKRLLKCYVWSVLLYGCEAWTLSTDLGKRIEAFEMWCYRRMMKVSYIDRKMNEEVLRMVNGSKELLNICRDRKMRYFGHVVRGGGILLEMLMGKIEGTRPRGRPRFEWMDDIKWWSGQFARDNRGLMAHARNRDLWREVVANPLSRGKHSD